MPEMQEVLSDWRTHVVLGPMCHWRMTATDDRSEQGFVRGKTRWWQHCWREHARENRRVRLIGHPTDTCDRSVESAREAVG